MQDWVTVEGPGGAIEVRGPASDQQDAPQASLWGTVRVTQQGWIAKAPDGRAYGPFPTMGEAAYPLALAGQGHDARALLGKPLPGGVLPRRAAATPVGPTPRGRRNRLISLALLAVAVAAVVAERRVTRA